MRGSEEVGIFPKRTKEDMHGWPAKTTVAVGVSG
jgi:hypothetical protein